jgi:hypothetical protein
LGCFEQRGHGRLLNGIAWGIVSWTNVRLHAGLEQRVEVKPITSLLALLAVAGWGAVLGLAGCGSSNAACAGTPATTMLIEGYCKNGEAADRCYYDSDPMDGF